MVSFMVDMPCFQSPEESEILPMKQIVKIIPVPNKPKPALSFESSLVSPDASLFPINATDYESVAEITYIKSIYDTAGVELAKDTPQIVTAGVKPYRIIDVNPKWLAFCGFTRDDVMGNTLKML